MTLQQADQIIRLVNRFVPEATAYMVNPFQYGEPKHDDGYAVEFGVFNTTITNFQLAIYYYGRLVGV
mgnify:FL=1